MAGVNDVVWAAVAAVPVLIVAAVWVPRRGRKEQAGGVRDDVELVRSPQTGELTTPGETAPAPAPTGPVAPRVRTTASLPERPALGGAPRRDGSGGGGGFASSRALGHARREHLLGEAWESRDLEALAAQGELDDPSRLAAFILAAHLGAQHGDPRTGHWLYRAFLTGQDPAEDPLLDPYRNEVTFEVEVAEWGIRQTVECTRVGLALAAASSELRDGDPDSAYGVLLDAPEAVQVTALRAAAAVRLQWWGRALRATPGPIVDVWTCVWACAHAEALAGKGEHQAALGELDAVLDAARDGGWDKVWARAVFLRAQSRRETGDTDGAWGDLTGLLQVDPAYPGAIAALKAL